MDAPQDPVRLVDSHCHLQLLPDALPVERALAEARAQGVDRLICVSVDLQERQQLLEYCSGYEGVSASVGTHPNTQPGSAEPDVEMLVEAADDPHVVAIGETGLDYFRVAERPAWQQERFRTHIRASVQTGKPLIVHSREARDDTLRLLEEEGARSGVMHCFVEDEETAQRAMALGFYISFSGILTFRNAQALRDTASTVPMERLLVETDTPYLAPVPHRGATNQPAYVRHVAACLAELKGCTLAALAQQTTRNCEQLFGI